MSIAAVALVAAYVGVLIGVTASDVVSRRIPNWMVAALVVVFAIGAALGLAKPPLWSALAAAAVSLAGGYALYAFKVVGAGDAKLFAATALFAGLQNLGALALATVLLGGALALVVLVARPKRALAGLTRRGRESPGRGIPYGAPIACAALLVGWPGALIRSWI